MRLRDVAPISAHVANFLDRRLRELEATGHDHDRSLERVQADREAFRAAAEPKAQAPIQ